MTKSTIAILLTDYSLEHIDKHGNFADQTIELLQDASTRVNQTQKIDFQVFDAIKSELPTKQELQQFRAIWITGSTADSFSNDPWILNLVNFIQDVYHGPYNVPFIGICFGHQVLSRALGGSVERSTKGWELGSIDVELNPENDPSLASLLQDEKSLKLLSVHQDVVVKKPENWVVLGQSKLTAYQGFYEKGKVLTFQSHPEFKAGLIQDVVDKLYSKGSINTDLKISSESTLTSKDGEEVHDGKKAGDFILRFIQDE